MKKNTTLFVAVWCVLSVLCAVLMLHFTVEDNTKMSQFVFVNTLFMVGLGIFFAVYRDKITVLLGNYKREKEI